MGSDAADRIRLTVPADPEMVDVVRAAVRSLCARIGLGETGVDAARAEVGEAFLELTAVGVPEIELAADVSDDDLEITLRAGDEARRVAASR